MVDLQFVILRTIPTHFSHQHPFPVTITNSTPQISPLLLNLFVLITTPINTIAYSYYMSYITEVGPFHYN